MYIQPISSEHRKYYQDSIGVYLKYQPVKVCATYISLNQIVAYKRPTNIHDMLVHSKMNESAVSYNVTKCNRRRCSHCLTINESDCFTSSTTSCVHKIRQTLSCISTDVIYLITCKKCEAQYVGQTHQKCANRMNNHIFDYCAFSRHVEQCFRTFQFSWT